jgi:hypothetical protein
MSDAYPARLFLAHTSIAATGLARVPPFVELNKRELNRASFKQIKFGILSAFPDVCGRREA